MFVQAVTPLDCTALRQDYFECLHHRKEYARLNAVQEQKDRSNAAQSKHRPSPASVQF